MEEGREGEGERASVTKGVGGREEVRKWESDK